MGTDTILALRSVLTGRMNRPPTPNARLHKMGYPKESKLSYRHARKLRRQVNNSLKAACSELKPFNILTARLMVNLQRYCSLLQDRVASGSY